MSEEKIGPELYKRDQHGLLINKDYVYNEDGSVNWRAMIPKQFLYIRKEWFTSRNKEVPDSPDGLEDNQLAIMLGGIKELAKLRGYEKVKFKISHHGTNYVVAKCCIRWIGNYETTDSQDFKIPISYEEVGNATADNTNEFCLKFLETIACNRAFVRCVRNFLNIHIVGVDELDNSEEAQKCNIEDSKERAFTPTAMLKKTVANKLKVNFNEFKEGFLKELWKSNKYRNEDAKNWKSFEDIPAKEARKLMDQVKKS